MFVHFALMIVTLLILAVVIVKVAATSGLTRLRNQVNMLLRKKREATIRLRKAVARRKSVEQTKTFYERRVKEITSDIETRKQEVADVKGELNIKDDGDGEDLEEGREAADEDTAGPVPLQVATAPGVRLARAAPLSVRPERAEHADDRFFADRLRRRLHASGFNVVDAGVHLVEEEEEEPSDNVLAGEGPVTDYLVEPDKEITAGCVVQGEAVQRAQCRLVAMDTDQIVWSATYERPIAEATEDTEPLEERNLTEVAAEMAAAIDALVAEASHKK